MYVYYVHAVWAVRELWRLLLKIDGAIADFLKSEPFCPTFGCYLWGDPALGGRCWPCHAAYRQYPPLGMGMGRFIYLHPIWLQS